MTPRDLGARTIADFGEQWSNHGADAGYYASPELFADILGPLLAPGALRGARVADVGSGTGRVVRMLLSAGAAHVTALEPSAAFPVLQRNLADAGDRVTLLQATADRLPLGGYDFVFALGVLHHVPEPASAVRAALEGLRPGGRLVAWFYGREGNGLYLAVARALRTVTTRLPHRWLALLSRALAVPLGAYAVACRVLPLPLRAYMCNHVTRLDGPARALTIYDQLNPAYAAYYREAEVRSLLEGAGFVDVRLHHRHAYSWTALATRAR